MDVDRDGTYPRTLLIGVAVVLFLASTVLFAYLWKEPKCPPGLSRPPSPPGARLISGHSHLWALNVSNRPHETQLVKWARKYGEIYQIRLGSERWVVLSSPEAVKEVFDRQGALTGSRPRMRIAMDILSGGYRMLFLPYGKQWRDLRAIAHRRLNTRSADQMKPMQNAESVQYLHDVLVDPRNFLVHVRRYTASVIMYSMYGRRVVTLDDPTLKAIWAETAVFSEAVGTRFLVDQYPVLEKLPKSLQWWRPYWEKYHQKEMDLWRGLWNRLKKQLEAGTRTGCFAERLIEDDVPKLGITEDQGAYMAGTMIEAGSDTTQLSLNSLILGLVAFPETVKKAHEELDRVVGDRMPTFEDSPRLPYIRAMIKEVLRWRSVSNDHIRHTTTGDVTYNGYFIPAGSVVVINQWAMHYDPSLYPEPERFNPDRYIGTAANNLTAGECMNTTDVSKRDHWSFGAGRRACLGYNLAENSLFILTARLLWAFDVKAPVDSRTGRPTEYNLWDYVPTRLFGPRPFPAEFQVRKGRDKQIKEQIQASRDFLGS